MYFAVEGETDVLIAERMLRLIGVDPVRTLVAGGKSRLGAKIPGLNRSGAHMNWLILRDDLDNPKRDLVDLCRRSRRSEVKDAMVPRSVGGRLVGPEYASRIISFVQRAWDPEGAARRSPSLRKPMASLRAFVDRGVWS